MEIAYRQHKSSLDAKDSQIRHLKERIAILERNDSPQTTGEGNFTVDGERQSAVQVKILRVKGRTSQEEERPGDEKDLEITRLKADLAAAKSSTDTLVRAQEELTRAWETMNSMQKTLNDERHQHAQTRDRLQETAVRLEEEFRQNSQKNLPSRLPTIEESDKQELEAMFDAADRPLGRPVLLKLGAIVNTLEAAGSTELTVWPFGSVVGTTVSGAVGDGRALGRMLDAAGRTEKTLWPFGRVVGTTVCGPMLLVTPAMLDAMLDRDERPALARDERPL